MRGNVSSSRLVRLLSDSTDVDMDASREDVAQRLGRWLDTLDTLKLSAAHQSIEALAQGRASDGLLPGGADTLEDAFQQAQTAMEQAIAASVKAVTAAHSGTGAAYSGYRLRYLEQQRQMGSKIGPLRAQVRQVLSKVSPSLRQLAYLDAAMDQLVGGREQRLLSTVPVLLERRFEQLRRAARQGDDEGAGPDWLAAFGKEWQEALLAEMNVRLQPVVGLMEALSNKVKKSQ